jgi:hypothetical protein
MILARVAWTLLATLSVAQGFPAPSGPGGGAAAAAAGPGPPPLVPAGTVKITYDDWGFPHIEAINGGTDHSVAWGAGYVQARDFPVTTAYNLANLAYSSGSSGAPFHVALDPAGGPPEVHVMPVVGSTEVYDCRRYKAAVKFARREFITLAQPPGSPNAFHFLAAPGIYPDIPLDVLPGFFSGLAGLPLDAVIIYFDAQGIPVHLGVPFAQGPSALWGRFRWPETRELIDPDFPTTLG